MDLSFWQFIGLGLLIYFVWWLFLKGISQISQAISDGWRKGQLP